MCCSIFLLLSNNLVVPNEQHTFKNVNKCLNTNIYSYWWSKF